MPDSVGMRSAIIGGSGGLGGLLGAAVMRALDVAEVTMQPNMQDACQSALEVMSLNLSACMKVVGGG